MVAGRPWGSADADTLQNDSGYPTAADARRTHAARYDIRHIVSLAETPSARAQVHSCLRPSGTVATGTALA